MTLHLQGGPGFTRLKEEVDEGPFRERIAGEGERLVDGEPRSILDLVRFQAERFGIEVALVHEPERVRWLAGEPGDVDVQKAIEDDVHPNLLFGLALHSDFGALAVVHESAGDVPIAFREPADRFDHQRPWPFREDNLRDASDHRGVDRSLHERVDVAPLENRVSTEPLVRMVIEQRLFPQDAVIAEVHHAVGLGPKRERLADAGEPERATITNEVDLAIRLDEDVVAVWLPTHAKASMPMRYIKCSREEFVKNTPSPLERGSGGRPAYPRTFSATETPSRSGTIAAIIRGSFDSRSL